MKTGYRHFALLIMIALLVVSLVPAAAQDETTPTPPLDLGGVTFNRSLGSPQLNTDALPTSSLSDATLTKPVNVAAPPVRGGNQASQASTPSGLITALVVLNTPPALATLPSGATMTANTASSVASAASSVQASQARVTSSLSALGGVKVVGSIRFTANALVVKMDASQIAAVQAISGVSMVVPDQIGHLDNAHSVPFIGAVQAWEDNGGYTGAGIRIGIINSGIDYTHANFGGSGDTTHYTNNDTTTYTDNIVGGTFDGSKVVGGYDFVGDAWTGGDLPTTAPTSPYNSLLSFSVGDNDPLDCISNGHGSHTSGTVAGYGVDEFGNTFTGPWDSSVPFSTMIIGPGVAPEATLYALKIGGCTSSVSFIAAALALDFVVDPNGDGDPSDHLDVINNSYGGAYGTPLEILDSQFDYVAQAGVIPVASAGNSGDTYYVNGDPSVSDWTIAVAASISDTVYGGLEITTGDASFSSYPTVIAANPSQGGATGSFGPYALKLVGGGDNDQGCSTDDYADFAGEAGLIVWTATTSGCGSATRMNNAVDAFVANGGDVAGLVVVSANPADFPFINLACTYNLGPSSIPCVSVAANEGALLAANPGAFTVRFDSTLQGALAGTSIGDMLAGFSSRGPRTSAGGDIALKPDISAPGQSITSTGVGTGNGAATESGTSMSGPHITGSAALMRQLHPTWSVPQIKALLMNTATNDLWTEPDHSGINYGVSRVGAGRVDLINAINSDVIAYDTEHPERVSVSFGLVEVVDTVNIVKSVTVANLGSTDETYDVSFQQMNDTPGVQFLVSPSLVSVPAGETRTIQVTLTANKASMANANTPDPTTPTTQNGVFGELPRDRIMEEGGYVVLTSHGSSSDLRVPLHAVPRPSADMKADGAVQIGAADSGFTFLPLTGKDVFTGTNFPDDIVSQVSAFQLVGTDPQTLPTEFGGVDIQNVGITSDYLDALNLCAGNTTCAINNTTIFVAISVYGQWSSLNPVDSWFDVHFDVDENGSYDKTVFNMDTGLFFTGLDATDTFWSFIANGCGWLICNNGPYAGMDYINGVDPSVLELYGMNNGVIVLPVYAANIGLTAANTDFQFDVLAEENFNDANGTYDWVPSTWYTYDVAHPAYDFLDAAGFIGGPYLGAPIWNDTDGNAIPVTYDVTGLADLPPILLLHHHNAADAEVGRAEVVQVERTGDMDGKLIKTVDNAVPAEGDAVTFTIELGNNGPGPLVDPVVTDLLPTGLTYVSDTCPGTSSQSAVSGGTQIVCDMTGLTIPTTLSGSADIVATVDSGTNGTTLTNRVDLTGYNSAMTDTDPGNDFSLINVCVGGSSADACNLPLTVANQWENTGISLQNGTVVGTQVDKLFIQFNQPVREGDGVDGADNFENYRFLSEGPTPGFQTASCDVPVDAGDTAHRVDAVYNSSTATTTLGLNHTGTITPLPEGNYRLIVCGSTSILNTQDEPLDGGSDHVTDFSVNFTNGITSPSGGTAGEGSASSSVLSAEELAGMQLPSTGETPQSSVPLILFSAVVGAGLVALAVYLRR